MPYFAQDQGIEAIIETVQKLLDLDAHLDHISKMKNTLNMDGIEVGKVRV